MSPEVQSSSHERMRTGRGFIAALDQSGGSTPKALKLYGIDESSYSSETEMFTLVHQMRTRILTSPVFTGERILAVILFNATMQEKVDGLGTAEYLLTKKGIPSFLKVDNGLEIESQGVQLMKPIPELDSRLDDALLHKVIGTKMRSVIKLADIDGIKACVDQQFELAMRILAKGLIPIIEPEVDIKSPQKQEAENILHRYLLEKLNALSKDQKVILKMTLPTQTNLYTEMVAHPQVLRVAALSGGYSREEATALLAENDGLIASFSRALTEGLGAKQSDDEFNATLNQSIESIFNASH
ncbi:COG3588 Fructose-1,6-bisphosphate aldolase [Candidatus Nanopelagicaceae bacterium]